MSTGPHSDEIEDLQLTVLSLARKLNATLDELRHFEVEAREREHWTILALDHAWLLLTGMLVFFMQGGFALLEAGFVSQKNFTNILFKNIADACVSATAFWLFGYALAYGPTTASGIFGHDKFALTHAKEGFVDDYSFWFFQWVFASTAATIVSGSIAERTKFESYVTFSFLMSGLYYPVVVHWVWGEGFMSAWGANPDEFGHARPLLTGTEKSNGVIDFAGSGVVHMVGGISGLLGATVVGPRRDRFDPNTGRPIQLSEPNPMLITLGTFILWVGWYAFNCGSTLGIHADSANISGKVAVNTTLSAVFSCFVTTTFSLRNSKGFQLAMSVNGILSGLVSVTAACAIIEPWMAMLVGLVGGVVFLLSTSFLKKMQIDDPLDACCVHGACGIWGMLAVGVFCTDANVQFAGYPNVNDACSNGEQFGVQLLAIVAISLWTSITAGGTFLLLHRVLGLRVTAEHETAGMDFVLHHTSPLPKSATDPKQQGQEESQGRAPSGVGTPNLLPIPSKHGVVTTGPEANRINIKQKPLEHSQSEDLNRAESKPIIQNTDLAGFHAEALLAPTTNSNPASEAGGWQGDEDHTEQTADVKQGVEVGSAKAIGAEWAAGQRQATVAKVSIAKESPTLSDSNTVLPGALEPECALAPKPVSTVST